MWQRQGGREGEKESGGGEREREIGETIGISRISAEWESRPVGIARLGDQVEDEN